MQLFYSGHLSFLYGKTEHYDDKDEADSHYNCPRSVSTMTSSMRCCFISPGEWFIEKRRAKPRQATQEKRSFIKRSVREKKTFLFSFSSFFLSFFVPLLPLPLIMSNKVLDAAVYQYLVDNGQKEAAAALKKNSQVSHANGRSALD